MKKTKERYSKYIRRGLVLRRSNIVFEKILRVFFSNIKFDQHSLEILNEYKDSGHIVYVSFQNRNTALLILMNLLRRNKLQIPSLALDISPYLFQIITNTFRIIGRFFNSLFRTREYIFVNDFDYIARTLKNSKGIVFSLLSRKLFKRRYLDVKWDTLAYLIEVQMQLEKPIYLFPQIMFWNRNPERTKTLFTSHSTGDRRLLSAIFVLFKSMTPAHMRICEPINIKEEIEKSPSKETREIARTIRNNLLERYNHEKRVVLGPILKTKQEMIENVLYHKNVMDVIEQVKAEEHKSDKHLRKKAYRYLKEIAADFSIFYIKFFDWSLEFIYNKLFDGINYNIEDFAKISAAAQKGPLIILPNHRSHMDYLIVSSMFYRNKLIPPHIIAGSNLTFFPMGKIFRRSGAFFMRRSFKGNQLYSVIFKQYIKTLIHEGYSIEFFIEGGRSRTGKLVFPKMGILKYLIESIEEGYNRDMVFVPVSINYDRILEESSYLRELKGKEKQKESTSAFLKSRKLLKRQYGRVFLKFHDPVTYTELKELAGEEEDLTSFIGNHIVKKINEIIIVAPFAATSTALILCDQKGFTKTEALVNMKKMVQFLKYVNAPISDVLHNEENFPEVMHHVIESFNRDHAIVPVDDKIEKSKKFNDDTELYIHEEDRARINIYKNNIIHYLLPIAFISISILHEAPAITKGGVVNAFNYLKNIFSKEFIFSELMNDSERVQSVAFDYLAKNNTISLNADNQTITIINRSDLVLYSHLIQEFIESYFAAFSAMNTVRKRERKELVHDIRLIGSKIYQMNEIKMIESLSLPNYNNALDKCAELGVIKEVKQEKKSTIEIINVQKILEFKNEIKKFLSAL